MQIGDLVMWRWLFDGMIGIITKVHPITDEGDWYDVVWSDSTFGWSLHEEELMAVIDEKERQS